MSAKTKRLENAVVLITDLISSTEYKQCHGHDRGLERILLSLNLSESIIRKHNGKIIKNLGDGLLVYFKNPINAIKAAIKIKEQIQRDSKSKEYNIELKFTLTVGMIQILKLNKLQDIFGVTVDRCARIISIAKPNQIIIEESLYNSIETMLQSILIKVSDSETINIKNYPEIKVREICSIHEKFKSIKVIKYPPFVEKNRKLYCDTCHQEITEKQIRDSMALIEFDSDIQPDGKEIVKDCYIIHKMVCDKNIGTGWRDIYEFMIPELYLDLILSMINQLNDDEIKYSDKAKQKIYDLLFFLYPYVFRGSAKEEYEEFLRIKELLQFGL